jgi:hypothetical protein
VCAPVIAAGIYVGARVTVPLAILFLVAVLLSTPFIDRFRSAWQAGVPLFVLRARRPRWSPVRVRHA